MKNLHWQTCMRVQLLRSRQLVNQQFWRLFWWPSACIFWWLARPGTGRYTEAWLWHTRTFFFFLFKISIWGKFLYILFRTQGWEKWSDHDSDLWNSPREPWRTATKNIRTKKLIPFWRWHNRAWWGRGSSSGIREVNGRAWLSLTLAARLWWAPHLPKSQPPHL